MILVRKHNARRRSRLLRIGVVLLICALLTWVLFLMPGAGDSSSRYFCDAEQVINEDGVEKFAGKGINFKNGFTQDKTYSHSGSHSVRLDKTHPFGMTFETSDIRPGERFDAIVWRRKGGEGTLVAQGSWGLYESFPEETGLEDGDWEQLRLSFTIPHALHEGTLKIYPWNPKVEPGWFDDLEIRRTQLGASAFTMPGSVPWKPEKVNLIISEKGMNKLETKRREALKRGMLFSEDDDYVKARIESDHGNKRARGKVRLKGDWTDHLRGDKWSFRVNLTTGESWNRMVVFSFQNPKTRHFLSEWVYHKMLEREDVLTTRYDLIELELNGVSKGIYAYEEHFVKQLPEFHKRREGPIIKMNEGGFWEMMYRAKKAGNVDLSRRVPIQEGSDIDAFRLNRTLKDSTLARQFRMATTLLEQYRTGAASCDEIFDLDRLARYFALVDVNQSYHGFIWHNLRFYYNPVLSRLEPIGFDGYTQDGPLRWLNRPFVGHQRRGDDKPGSFEDNLYGRFFADEKFVEAYIGHLYEYTSELYVSSFLQGLREEIEKRERLIQIEYPAYNYDYNFVPNQARALRAMILPLQNTSVKCNRGSKKGDKFVLEMRNYHCLPVRVMGTADSDGGEVVKFGSEIKLDAYVPSRAAPAAEVEGDEGDWLAFRIPGIDSVFYAPVKPYALPRATTPSQDLFRGVEPESNDLYKVDSNRVIFRQGLHEIREPVIIPAGYQVVIRSGTDLNFTNRAMFISRSPVFLMGTEEEPVRVRSSDGTMQGFTVLQANEESEVRFTVFDGMNTLEHRGWVLTGAVTFYESDVTLKNTRIINNHCEDALNTVRSAFRVEDCLIAHTFGDGFDSDFCSGSIFNTRFFKTGNDAIDFSGSEININYVEIVEAGDKGISVGEESTVTVETALVKDSPLGVASKDLSVLTIKKISLVGVGQGFAAYQKKPEYGPAKIKVDKYSAEDVETLYRLQMDSELNLEGKVIVGKI